METKIILNQCKKDKIYFSKIENSQYFTINGKDLYCKLMSSGYENCFNVLEGRLCDMPSEQEVEPVNALSINF